MESTWSLMNKKSKQNSLLGNDYGAPVGAPPTSDDSTEADLASLQNPQSTQIPQNNQVSMEQQLQDAAQQQGLKRKELGALQQGGIDQLKQYQQDYSQLPIQTDYSPMAALVDSINQNSGKTTNFAKNFQEQAARQETPQQKVSALSGMQKDILAQQLGMNKEDLGSLADQISAYKAAQEGQANDIKEAQLERQMGQNKLQNDLAARRADIAERNADTAEKRASAMEGFYANNNRSALQQDRIDNQAHQKIVTALGSDKLLGQRLTQVNNLDNAVSAFSQGTATPQQFSELQQAVRSNMGLKGSSGVGEREEVYLKSLGINSAVMKQFLTGKPQDIANFTDPAMISHVMKLVDIEKNNVQKQADQRIKALTAGHESIYERRPDLTEDLQNKTQAIGQQFKQEQDVKEAASAHPQDDAALEWAEKNPNDKRAADILKANGR